MRPIGTTTVRRMTTIWLSVALAATFALPAAGFARQQARQVITAGPAPIGPYSPAIVAGGLVFVSGLLSTDAEGKVVGDDVTAQTRRILDRLKEIFEASGSSMAQAVSVSVYLENASDAAAFDAVYRTYFRDAPPARLVVVTDLLLGARVEVSAIGVPKGAARQVIKPAAWPAPTQPMSYAVRAGDLVFLSGITARRPGTAAAAGDAAAQIETVLADVRVLLEAAGIGPEKVVASRIYLGQLEAFATMNGIYGKVFPADPPARATAIASSPEAGSLVTMQMVATTGPREVVGGPVPAGRVLSPGIRAGRFLFLSGLLGNTADNATDVAAQTRETLTRIGASLKTGGYELSDVADSTVFLPDLTHFAAMNAVYRELFPTAPPARATIGTPLVVRTGLVEIMVTAVK